MHQRGPNVGGVPGRIEWVLGLFGEEEVGGTPRWRLGGEGEVPYSRRRSGRQ